MTTAVTLTRSLLYQEESLVNNTWYEATFAATVSKTVINEFIADLKKLGYVNIEVRLNIT